MSIPRVTFSLDSATSYDCIAWAARSIIAGKLADEAMTDIPAALRTLYRVSDDITQRISTPTIWGDTIANVELTKLGEALSISPTPASFKNASDPAGISPIVLQLILTALAKLLEKLLSEYTS